MLSTANTTVMLPARLPRIFRLTGITLAVLFGIWLCWITAEYVSQLSEAAMREQLLLRTKMTASLLEYHHLRGLTGSPADVGSADYNAVYLQLLAARHVHCQIRDIYLFRVVNGHFIFLLDTDITLKRQIVPGTPYYATSPDIWRHYQDGTPFVEGPVADTWGVWVSGLVPIHDPATGQVVAMLGIDIDARDWQRTLLWYRILAFLGCAVFLALLILLVSSLRGGRRMASRAASLEQRYHDLFSHAQEVVFLYDPAKGFLTVNPSGEELLGYVEDELRTMQVATLLMPGEMDPIRTLCDGEANGVRFVSCEVHLRTRYNGVRIVAFDLRWVKAQGRRVIEGLARDITARKIAETRLHRFNECLLSFGPDPVTNINALTELTGELLQADCAIYNQVADTGVTTIGQWRVQTRCPLHERPDGHLCHEVIRRGVNQPYLVNQLRETPFAEKDPNIVPCGYQTYLGYPVSSDGEVIGTLCLLYTRDYQLDEGDTTLLNILATAIGIEETRLRAEDAVRWNEALLRSIISTSPLGFFVADHRTDAILYYTQPFCDIWRLPADLQARMQRREATNQDVMRYTAALLPDLPAKKAEAATLRDIENSIILDEETNLVDGRTISAYTAPMHDDRGNYIGRFHMFADVTAQKRLEGDLRQAMANAQAASRAKGDFLANMSHEIRTPLNGIIGISALLKDTPLDTRQQRFVRMLSASSESLLGIITDILDFSKIEAGKVELESVPFSLTELCENVANTCAYRAAEKGLALVLAVAPDVPEEIRGDMTRLRQVLVNLLGNAVKFTTQGEVIMRCAVERAPEGGRVLRCAVQDTGIGISPDRRAALFQPFSQVDASTTRLYGGSGLGLVISKRLIEMMGGEIGVESAPGEGSTFWVTLPLAQAADPLAAPAGWQGRRVLLMDACAASRHALVTTLTAWGMTVDAVASVAEGAARQHAGLPPYDLLLVDRALPDQDGVVYAQQRADQTAPPLLLLTTLTAVPDGTTLRAAGIDGVVLHPVGPRALLDAITHVLEPATAAAPPAGEVVSPRKTRGQILLAEDYEVNQLVMQEMLAVMGYLCDVAGNGREALAALARQHYDLVLMDCHMPEMDGYEATRRLRAQETGGMHVPVVALTANALAEERERCLAAGMDDFLTKPILRQHLQAALARWLPQSGEGGLPPQEHVPSAPPSSLFDYQTLVTYCSQDTELAEQIITQFLTEAGQDVQAMREAAQAGDARAISRLAHRIKGSCAYLGAEQLRTLAVHIEQEGPKMGADDLRRLVDEFHQAFQTLREHLAAGAYRPASAYNGG